ncbi:uncharacterized protein LOC113558155 [Rhopalosiphum maidis]|nr:uncharacterized protein LOC113558155 [Rhopalosiphum maidis]
MAGLINGSGINNIPELNIITTNAAVNFANKCDKKPIFYGMSGTDTDCKRACANDTAHVVNVTNDDSMYFENTKLEPGVYCAIGRRPACNVKTTSILMTINSVTCRSKYPRLFGGETGNDVIACNDVSINDPLNILWDYRDNVRVRAETIDMHDTDELLNNGAYRFRCRYFGKDSNGNNFIENPYDRLHPMRNYCSEYIYGAHPSIRPVVDVEAGTMYCDCGDPNVTRVRNINIDDRSTRCSEETYEYKTLYPNQKSIKIPYKCFTINSPIEDVGRYMPCPPDQFVRNGSRMASVNVIYSDLDSVPIEHPYYKDFNFKETMLGDAKGIRFID